jgi:beta-lactamase class D
VLAVLVLAGGAAARPAAVVRERPDLQRYFAEAGTVGAMVVREPATGVTVVVDRRRSRTRYLPSSTFKIPNSLIALETGLVKDVDVDLFPPPEAPILLDGRPLLPAACDEPVTLRTAFRFSCIPVYQTVARRVGRARYRSLLRRLRYGPPSRIPPASVDRFWLEGGFRISAVEQVDFLERLQRGELPVSGAAIDAVKSMMLAEEPGGRRLSTKTGYVFTTRPRVGWYVGWVEEGDRVRVFALNLDVTSPAHLAARTTIAAAILNDLATAAAAR